LLLAEDDVVAEAAVAIAPPWKERGEKMGASPTRTSPKGRPGAGVATFGEGDAAAVVFFLGSARGVLAADF
jgi:hypothetical protein